MWEKKNVPAQGADDVYSVTLQDSRKTEFHVQVRVNEVYLISVKNHR